MEQVTFKVLFAHHACDHFKANVYNTPGKLDQKIVVKKIE